MSRGFIFDKSHLVPYGYGIYIYYDIRMFLYYFKPFNLQNQYNYIYSFKPFVHHTSDLQLHNWFERIIINLDMGSVCRHVYINWLPFQTFPRKRCQCYMANLADFGKKKNKLNLTKSKHFPTSVIKRINRNSELKTDEFRRSK